MTERTNANDQTERTQDHFEQVPLEIVKKIAEEDIADDEENGVDVPAETSCKKAFRCFRDSSQSG